MTALTQVGQWTTAHPLITTLSASAIAVAAGIFTLRRMKATSSMIQRRKLSAGTLAAVMAFVICTSVSLNTSYRFTADGLGMTDTAERLLSCAAFESLIAMCVLGARERMDGDNKSPGWYGSAVWMFAALSSVPAWHEGGGLTTGTVVRVIVGSFGSALAAHSALGLELRHRTGAESQSPTAQITRDLRERLMARLGLAHRGQTAQQIAQARALSKAVDLADRYDRLSEQDKGSRKGARLAKRLGQWQDRAGIATDERQRDLYRARVAQRRFAVRLDITETESPWHTDGTPEEAAGVVAELEERIRRVEALADETEAAVAAQLTSVAGSGGTPVPGQRAETAEHGSAEGSEEDPETRKAGGPPGPAVPAHHRPSAEAAGRRAPGRRGEPARAEAPRPAELPDKACRS